MARSHETMLSRSLKAQFAAAIRNLLRPIVRQLIAYGVTHPVLNQMLKEVYVEVAEREFALPYKRQTDSRLALVTGIPRKEIPRLRRGGAASAVPAEVEDTVVTHAVGRWMAGPPYATPDGVARRLPYESSDPKAATFSRLVRELGVDVPVRAVLDELIRLGNVELLVDGTLRLRHEAHIPAAAVEGKLALLGSDPAELFSTIVHNLEEDERPWLQRKVVYDNVGSNGAVALQDEIRRLGEEYVRRANALVASYDRDRNPDAPDGARCRVVLGTYYFQEIQEEEPAPDSQAPPPPPGRIRRTR